MTIYIDFDAHMVSTESSLYDDIMVREAFQDCLRNWKDYLDTEELKLYGDIEDSEDLPEDMSERIFNQIVDDFIWENYESYEFKE